jgi:hypothetical protein
MAVEIALFKTGQVTNYYYLLLFFLLAIYLLPLPLPCRSVRYILHYMQYLAKQYNRSKTFLLTLFCFILFVLSLDQPNIGLAFLFLPPT